MNLNLNNTCAGLVHFSVKKCALIVLFLILSVSASAQFTVTATTTPETCTGNGAISLSVQNQTAGTTINYKVYAGTDATGTLVHDSSSPTVAGQPSGNYYIVATESTGNTPVSTATTTVVIDDETVPLEFTLDKTIEHCGNDATITVNVTNGIAVSYKATSLATGTVTGPQSSNILTGLTAGQYNVFVLDNCGNGDSEVITVLSEYHDLEISGALFPDAELPACDMLTISNQISSTNNIPIIYPLQATFTVYPPGGGSVVYTQTITMGDQFTVNAEQVVPYYYNQPNHSYKLTITDICGNSIETPLLPINPMPGLFAELKNIDCSGKTIELTPNKFVSPFTLEVIDAPAGFDPADYNDQFPGPYNSSDVPIKLGEEGNPLPIGNYQFRILDACNRPIAVLSNILEIPVPDIEVTTNASAANCLGGGKVEAYIPGLFVGVAEMTNYVGDGDYPTPADISQYIQPPDGDSVIVGGLPPGTYTITLTDTCGVTYPPVEFIIEPYKGDQSASNSRPDCEVGYGTLNISGTFNHIEIISGPSGYPVPQDVTAYVTPGGLSMDHLPPGQYKFKASNDCDDDIEINKSAGGIVQVFAYNVTVNEYTLTPHCGSFDIFINHQSTGVTFLNFGLQFFDEDTGLWINPDNGNPYIEGDAINTDDTDDESNAIKVKNNFNNLDLVYPSGKYRIIKQFTTYADGSIPDGDTTKLCTEILYEFNYYSDIVIDGAVSLDCMGDSGGVQIIAHGVPPLNYKIISKNGQPFVVDNGQNNIFSDLESAVYSVEVSDQCSQRTLTFNIAEIPSLVSLPAPEEINGLELCDEGNDGKETFDISSYTALLINGQDTDYITITYHTSLTDAEQGINAIADIANITTATTIIYARAVHSSNPDCTALTHFDLIVRPLPVLSMKDKWGGCDGKDITITADEGYDYYEWSNQEGTLSITGPNEITVSNAGFYTVLVRDSFGCKNSKTVEAVVSPIPVINTVKVEDWTDNSNVITVVMESDNGENNFEYSLDNINYQDSPVFTGLAPGQYTVYVKDKFNCGLDTQPTYILTYPKFFTPNGDNINDYWKIKFSSLEPDMLIYIYDRYGKLITGFGADSKGWDGTFNDARLPATDYWFVVKRQNGEELKGHFSMIR